MGAKKILSDGLTNKQRILRMVDRWDDDIPFEQALYHLHVMKEVMESIKEVEEGGELVDHDDFFDELERLCDEEQKEARLVSKGKKKSTGIATAHRGERSTKNGKRILKTSKKIRGATS